MYIRRDIVIEIDYRGCAVHLFVTTNDSLASLETIYKSLWSPVIREVLCFDVMKETSAIVNYAVGVLKDGKNHIPKVLPISECFIQ